MSYNKKKRATAKVEEERNEFDISSKLGTGPIKDAKCPKCGSKLMSWSVRCVYYCIACARESTMGEVEVFSGN